LENCSHFVLSAPGYHHRTPFINPSTKTISFELKGLFFQERKGALSKPAYHHGKCIRVLMYLNTYENKRLIKLLSSKTHGSSIL